MNISSSTTKVNISEDCNEKTITKINTLPTSPKLKVGFINYLYMGSFFFRSELTFIHYNSVVRHTLPHKILN